MDGNFSNYFGNQFPAKNSKKYYCEVCDFYSSRKSNFNDHILTDKHKNSTNGNQNQPISNEKQQIQQSKYICLKCNKKYKDKSGLWKHKKKCKQEVTQLQDEDEVSDKKLIQILVKQNAEIMKGNQGLQNMIVEICKNFGPSVNNSHNNTVNSHNKAFNLNFFLNETCKNAMNINDFVDSIKLELSDLEKVGEVGFVEGISNIIINNLKKLDITERPIHCSDPKREVMYIKDDNKWEKENEEKLKLKKLIKRVANKNISLISEFKAKYPDCVKSDSKRSDQYNKIIIEGYDLYNEEKQDKIIRKIAKEVVIQK